MWTGIVFAEDKFIVTSSTGSFLTSDDGENWISSTEPPGEWWDITYGNGKWVAVGDHRFMTSDDGEIWTSSGIIDGRWRSVTFGNSLFVAAGPDGEVMTSPDGENWTKQSSGVTSALNDVAYGSGLFMIVGNRVVLTSKNGVDWTKSKTPELTYDWKGVAYSEKKFVVVSSAGNGVDSIITLDVSEEEDGGLYFDGKLLYTSVNVEPILGKVNVLANAVVNNADEVTIVKEAVIDNAEKIEVIAPTVFRGLWDHSAIATPADGHYSFVSSDGSFSGVTEMTIHPLANQGENYSVQFSEVTKHQVVTVLKTEAPWGFTARVSADPVIGVDDIITLQLSDVKGIDNPNAPPDIDGLAIIKVQEVVDPKNIKEINYIIDGLNANFNNIADQRGVVWINDEISLPAFLPSGSSIPNGKLYFNSRYLQLYIYVGGSWLGLL